MLRKFNANDIYEFGQVYAKICRPLCQELHIPQTAFDILMFLANNPDCYTARDIVEIRRIKPSLVSINVEKLVREGLVERRPVPGDRRKTMLVCTEKAQPMIESGRKLHDAFFTALFEGVDEEEKAVFLKVLENVKQNLDQIMGG